MPELIDHPRAAGSAALAAFSDPASVAVVGASADPAKWGWWLARGALRGAARREVYLVNRSGTPVLGASTYRSVADLPSTPELVVLCVPAAAVPDVVEQALAAGTRAFLGITAGVDAEGGLAERIRAAGGRLIGMNSLGIFDAATDLELIWGTLVPGRIAVVSQSGQIGTEIAGLAARAGMGISRFVSIGNQTDVGVVELLDGLVDDPATRVVALYLESFRSGRALVEVLARLRAAGKYPLVLTVGASAASARLARSHTGSLTSALDVVDAAMRAAGAVRVHTPAELVDAAVVLMAPRPPSGRRIAVVGDSGGQTGIAADVAAAAGLQVTEFGAEHVQRIADLLPAGAASANPVDLAGSGERDLATYPRVVEAVADSDDVDAVLLTGYFGNYANDNPHAAQAEADVVAALADVVARTGKPLIVHSMAADGTTVDELRRRAIPRYSTIDTAVRALAAAAGFGAPRPRSAPDVVVAGPRSSGYAAAQDFLRPTGLAFPLGRIVRTLDDVDAAATELAGPYVLKASWLEHKSEVGGVAVGIADVDALREAWADMYSRLGAGDYVVEEMDHRADVVEMILGVRHDPDFGPTVLVGAGGVDTELFADVAIELAPVDHDTARAMVRRLATHRRLLGWRGKPPVDVDTLVDLIVDVSRHAAAARGVADVEINPLRVAPGGVVAVDALVISSRSPSRQNERTMT